MMNVSIQISDDKAPAVKAQAQAEGLTVEQWIEKLTEYYTLPQPISIAHLQRTNPKEWARQFHDWAESHDRTTPLLSDEAINRESLYPDRF